MRCGHTLELVAEAWLGNKLARWAWRGGGRRTQLIEREREREREKERKREEREEREESQ